MSARDRVVPALTGAVVALMLLTGCQGDDDPSANQPSDEASSSSVPTVEPVSTPTVSATPGPSPASSAGPAANIPVPVKPALADENSAEGLEAFTEYWFELLSYSYITNDWAAFDGTTDPGCRTCASIKMAVNELYGQGRWVDGGEVRVVSFDTAFERTTTGSVTSFVENQQDEIVYFDNDGSILKKDPKQNPPSLDVVNAIHEQGRWYLLDYGAPEGAS